MENQPISSDNENQNIKYIAAPHQGSKWKTGLSRFKSNVSKPTLCSLPSKENQENELSHQKIVVVNINESGVQKNQTNLHQKSLYSKNTRHQSSTTNSNQIQQLYLPSSLFDHNSIISNNDDFMSNEKKVHFNTEESSNNDFNPLQKPSINNYRPKTQIQQNIKHSHISVDHFANYGKAKSRPLYYNQHKSISRPIYNDVHKSFDAHFKKQKEAIEAFKKRETMISERMYKMKCQKIHQLMNWKEFNPEAKVTCFTDNYVTEEVHEEARRERELNDLPDNSSVVDGKYRLPPDRQLTGYRRDRVFFWG